MTRTDLLLRILTAAEGQPLTPVVLQKVTFLLGKEFPNQLPDDFYQFQKDAYGPFCKEIYRDAEALQRDGLVTISRNEAGGWKDYAASFKAATVQVNSIPEQVASYIVETVSWARGLSFQELVRHIYQRFPEYRENSVFQS